MNATAMEDQATQGAALVEVPGDVDFAHGDIDCPGDLAVGGSILDQLKVRAAGSIRVGHAIEAAEVHAGRDLDVEGGIVGRQKGCCTAGGIVRAKFLADAHIDARGDVRIVGDISNSSITTAGAVEAPQGSILGGCVIANGGIRCAVLGSSSGVPTIVEAGTDAALRQRATADLARLDALHQRAEKIQETVGPLMRNQKKLTAQQKEKATELLFQASEVQQQIEPDLRRLERELAESAAAGRLEIHVEQVIHPGTVVRFPGIKATIEHATAGPVIVIVRQFGRERRIMLTTPDTKCSTELATFPVADECTAMIARMMAKLTGAAAA